MRLALPLVALCSLIPISAFAQEYRVRPPGACPNQGDGQSWSCAGALVGLVTVWDRGVAGSVYYLAGGTWTLDEVWQLDAPADGEAVIRLVHASEQANGCDVGWSPDFAEPVAMRPAPSQNETAINISTPYWVLDGVHRAGWDAGYGWQISYRGGDGQSNETFVIVGDAASEVTIRNIHFLHTHRLTASAVARNAGADLGAPYDQDLDGHPRGWDGDWDIGAHEYCDESCPASGGAGERAAALGEAGPGRKRAALAVATRRPRGRRQARRMSRAVVVEQSRLEPAAHRQASDSSGDRRCWC